MKDRNVQFPNRFEIVAVPGTTNIFEVNPAPGKVYEEGTFWSKANVLKDATAARYGKGDDASPDDIFAAIRPLIQAAQSTADGKAKIQEVSYTGTGTHGEANPTIVRFSFPPKLVFLVGETDVCYAENVLTTYTENGFFSFKINDPSRKAQGYGKRSNDGKTFYMYGYASYDQTGNAAAYVQRNSQGSTYKYIAIS